MPLRYVLAAAVGVALAALPPPEGARADPARAYPPFLEYEAYYAQFIRQRPDSSRVATVDHLTIERAAGSFLLERGELVLCEPVGGRVCAAVFVGEGAFSFTPASAFERAQLRRYYQTATLTRGFEALVLVFADTTFEELSRTLSFTTRAVPARAGRHFEQCLEYVSRRKEKHVDPGMARPILEGRVCDYFHAFVEGVDRERLFFEIDPSRTEDVVLWREPPRHHIGFQRIYPREIVCQFARGAADSGATGDQRRSFAIRSYRIACRIADNLDFSAAANLECESLEDGATWTPLKLYEELEVDSVAWDGRPTRFFKDGHGDMVWIRSDPPMAKGERRALHLSYRGDLITNVGDWFFVKSSVGWYPRDDSRATATFDLTFQSPSRWHLTSVGKRVASSLGRDVTTSRWVTDTPVRNAAFVLGLFREESFGAPGAPPVTALMFRGKPDPVVFRRGSVSITSGTGMEDKVAADVARCVAFFHETFGPAVSGGFRVAEIPALRGEAWPGLINIPQTTFSGPNAAAEDQAFRSHEVAHQWWGHGVDYRTYHDHWLSEGFADFSALWYLQAGLKDNKDYFAVLDGWRNEIMADRRSRPEGGRPAGPIWLGYRNASPADHALVVYKKGAWVLHMLRSMLLDLDTMDEGRFRALMRDFYQTYAGSTASTEDFLRVAEKHAGQDLGWFFDEWVYGSYLPAYRFAYRTRRTPEGTYRASCRVEQAEVPSNFRMPVLIRVDFGAEKFAWYRAMIDGPVTRFDLPPMPTPPKRITFNDAESVLCEVHAVAW